jgi:hypothetical protein
MIPKTIRFARSGFRVFSDFSSFDFAVPIFDSQSRKTKVPVPHPSMLKLRSLTYSTSCAKRKFFNGPAGKPQYPSSACEAASPRAWLGAAEARFGWSDARVCSLLTVLNPTEKKH